MRPTNTRVVLASYPTGWVTEDNMRVETVPIPELTQDDDVLVKVLDFSIDPYMRGRMRETKKSYTPPFQLDQVLTAGAVGVIYESKNANFAQGQLVSGMLGWEQFTLVKGGRGLTKLSTPTDLTIPLSYFLGILGMPGYTAYWGLIEIGKPKAGETLFISAASGAVGQVVGQIGKILGLRVVGSVGSDEKVNFLLEELGFDAVFNYKTRNIGEALDELCPNGIDIYFENVGGEQLDEVLARLNVNARVPVCGMISQYNATPENAYGVKNLMSLISKRITMQGFIISDHFASLPKYLAQASQWIREGKLKYREHVVDGVQEAPKAFVGMLKGENFGKAVIHVANL